MKKKHGWVLFNRLLSKSSPFTTLSGLMSRHIKEAQVFSTRKKAREADTKFATDSIRKVKVNKKGQAIKIIPGR